MNVTNGTLIMDNASIHKTNEVKLRLQCIGFKLIFLPPYSPQLNPIEEVFSKWKHLVKKRNCNTIEDLKKFITVASFDITRTDCANYFSHVREFILRGIRREIF